MITEIMKSKLTAKLKYMKLHETKKLHYNKFLYKLVMHNTCSSFFRTEFNKQDLSYARQKIDSLHHAFNPKKQYIELAGYRGTWKDLYPVNDYYDAITIYRHLRDREVCDYIVRCERNTLTIYSNDRKWLIKLGNNLKTKISEFWEPDPENVSLLQTNKNIILVNKVPDYEYKITLGKKKGLPSLAKWIDNNPKLAKMGDIARQECYNSGWVKGYYFHVRDEKALFIVQMLVGDNIQRIDKFVNNR